MTEATGSEPTMGELLATARRDSAAFASWLARHDPALAARLEAGLVPGDTPNGRIREAVGHFATQAEHTSWVQLVSAMRDSDRPGLAALRIMLDWSLREGAGR